MSDDGDDTPIASVTAWLETLEGQQVPDAGGNKVPYCDSCVSAIQPGERAQMKYADVSFHSVPPTDLGTLVTMSMECEDCAVPVFPLPCKGVNEVMAMATLDKDGRLWDFEAGDGSSATSGIEWNPREVVERVLGKSVDLWHMMTRTHLAPSDVAGMLRASGTDPRSVVKPDGSITDDEDVLREAREGFDAMLREARESGQAEKVMEKGERQDEWMLEQVGKDEWDGSDIFFDANEGEWVARDNDSDEEDDDDA